MTFLIPLIQLITLTAIILGGLAIMNLINAER